MQPTRAAPVKTRRIGQHARDKENPYSRTSLRPYRTPCRPHTRQHTLHTVRTNPPLQLGRDTTKNTHNNITSPTAFEHIHNHHTMWTTPPSPPTTINNILGKPAKSPHSSKPIHQAGVCKTPIPSSRRHRRRLRKANPSGQGRLEEADA